MFYVGFVGGRAWPDQNIIDPCLIYRARKRMGINYYMSVTVKVQFRDKLFKLSPGITCLAQIDQEMKRRYQERLPLLEYYFEGTAIDELKPLLGATLRKGKNSIKLEAKPTSSFSADNDLSIISIASSQIS